MIIDLSGHQNYKLLKKHFINLKDEVYDFSTFINGCLKIANIEVNQVNNVNCVYGFTPLYLVDLMIELKFPILTSTSTTCDLCAGYGQFTIRLMRKLYNRLHINVEEWLEKYHTFTELQFESCAKLVYIFGSKINLYAGDSRNLKYARTNESGILFFNEKEKRWENNELLNELLTYSIVKNNLKLLTVIFKNINTKGKLVLLKNKLMAVLLNETY